jgi:hypothetical protein
MLPRRRRRRRERRRRRRSRRSRNLTPARGGTHPRTDFGRTHGGEHVALICRME